MAGEMQPRPSAASHLCELFGPELNWHIPFHLRSHAASAAILVLPYVAAIPSPDPTKN